MLHSRPQPNTAGFALATHIILMNVPSCKRTIQWLQLITSLKAPRYHPTISSTILKGGGIISPLFRAHLNNSKTKTNSNTPTVNLGINRTKDINHRIFGPILP
ncbi:hypothetical protein PIB30_084945 [Stylosanthes scabra]|uniref:Uncharacterized protein n=1 Tax=Stylosanthes scabra TaxID=79078 RepID=A0ABU6WSC1_9FABA|nr:hypothetical protein [Stylosanthes scabra]